MAAGGYKSHSEIVADYEILNTEAVILVSGRATG